MTDHIARTLAETPDGEPVTSWPFNGRRGGPDGEVWATPRVRRGNALRCMWMEAWDNGQRPKAG